MSVFAIVEPDAAPVGTERFEIKDKGQSNYVQCILTNW